MDKVTVYEIWNEEMLVRWCKGKDGKPVILEYQRPPLQLPPIKLRLVPMEWEKDSTAGNAKDLQKYDRV